MLIAIKTINNRIIALNTYDGTSNLVIGNRDFTEYKILTNFDNGMHIYSITLYNGNYLIDAVINKERNLYLVDSSTGDSWNPSLYKYVGFRFTETLS